MRTKALLLLGFLAGCGSPTKCPPTSPSGPVGAPPVGRLRTGSLTCAHGEVRHYRVTYPWPNEDGTAVIEQGPRTEHSIPGIHLCGAWEGVEGAEVITCRDTDGRFDGPFEMLAPDNSIVLQGYCSKGVPLGPWVTWRAGRAVDIVAQDGSSGFHWLHVRNPPPDRRDLESRDEYEGVPMERVHR